MARSEDRTRIELAQGPIPTSPVAGRSGFPAGAVFEVPIDHHAGRIPGPHPAMIRGKKQRLAIVARVVHGHPRTVVHAAQGDCPSGPNLIAIGFDHQACPRLHRVTHHVDVTIPLRPVVSDLPISRRKSHFAKPPVDNAQSQLHRLPFLFFHRQGQLELLSCHHRGPQFAMVLVIGRGERTNQ